jgi:predicted dehydrogenase
VAVAARDRVRAQAFAAERGITKVYDCYADVIADPDVDLVYNALVNSLHARWNIAALDAGKHVLSEKPLTSNAEEARMAPPPALRLAEYSRASTTCTIRSTSGCVSWSPLAP